MDMCFKVLFIPYSSSMELKRKESVGNISEMYVKKWKKEKLLIYDGAWRRAKLRT